MRTFLSRLAAVFVLLSPLAATAQDASLDNVAKAMGAAGVKSIQYSGSGVNFQIGQNYSPDVPWPRFLVKSYTRAANYDTPALRDELVRLQGEDPPRGGGGQPVSGEQRQIFVMSGDFAWNVVGDVVNPSPIALIDRQLQLWTTPHGVVKAAMANKATVQGRVISFAVPGKFRVKATVDGQNLVEKIEAVAPNATTSVRHQLRRLSSSFCESITYRSFFPLPGSTRMTMRWLSMWGNSRLTASEMRRPAA